MKTSLNLDLSQIIKRNTNIYTFSKDPLERISSHIHFFIPWKKNFDNELMFKLTKIIKESGKTYIPFSHYSQLAADLSQQDFSLLLKQIESGVETHLIMSNFESIHILKVSGIYSERPEKCLFERYQSGYEKCLWIECSDIFVYQTTHIQSELGLKKELEELLLSPQVHHFFSTCSNEIKPSTRWIEKGRSITYDYYVRDCELKDNIYQDGWDALSFYTRHELISCDLHRFKAAFYKEDERWNLLKSSFYNYKNSVLSELNHIYIFPLQQAIQSYESLNTVWEDTVQNVSQNTLYSRLANIIVGEQKSVSDLGDFIFYFLNSRSFLYSLKSKFTKLLHKPEFLMIENFLQRQESLVESFTCRDLLKYLELIDQIEGWINYIDNSSVDSTKKESEGYNQKLAHLLEVMASSSYDDNIMFKLLEEKLAKGQSKKSFEDKVKALSIPSMSKKVA